MNGVARHTTQAMQRLANKTMIEGKVWGGHQKIVDRFETRLRGTELLHVSKYLFNSTGKNLRPKIISAMAGAVNVFSESKDCLETIKKKQDLVIQISEMYHTASLYHDDVIDNAGVRRGQPSVPAAWSTKHAIMGGDFVLAVAYGMLAEVDNEEVTSCMSRVVKDLVEGELLQMSGKVELEDSMDLYEFKCYLKTASLLANGCRSVAYLANEKLADEAEQFGKELGIGFQIVDDILDFTETPEDLGKPGGGADILGGIKTAPVILAAKDSPKLQKMLEENAENVEVIMKAVIEEGGVEKAKAAAIDHSKMALLAIENWKESSHKETLKELVELCINRSM